MIGALATTAGAFLPLLRRNSDHILSVWIVINPHLRDDLVLRPDDRHGFQFLLRYSRALWHYPALPFSPPDECVRSAAVGD
jgi:hypothetical protein